MICSPRGVLWCASNRATATAMQYPVGWPRVLDSRGATSGPPVKLLRHRAKDLLFELRERSLAVWHSRLHILLASYKLSHGGVCKHGVNTNAALKPDGTCVVVSTSKGVLYFLQVTYKRPDSSPVGGAGGGAKCRYSYREHGIIQQLNPGLDMAAEGRGLELVSLHLIHEASVSGLVCGLCCITASSLLVATDYGMLHRFNWEGKFDSAMAIHLSSLQLATDLLPDTRAEPLGAVESVRGIVFSADLCGLALVLSSGRAAFVSATNSKLDPKSLKGVWLKETTDGVCIAVNPRYSLCACGRKSGKVDVYALEDSTGAWNHSHTLQLSKLHFADSDHHQLGPVQCIEWAPLSHSVLTVAWRNGGVSLWTVFGSLLYHSLGNQPGTPTPLINPQCTLVQSLCWSSDGYQLWVQPRGECPLRQTGNLDQEREKEEEEGRKTPTATTAGNKNHLVVINFLKSAFVNNPVTPNHHYLLLHTADKLYIGHTHPLSGNGAGDKTDRMSPGGVYGGNGLIGGETAPHWRVTQVPVNYLHLNWPIMYVATTSNGDHIAIAGRAGFAVYLQRRRRWKLFGSEMQEQGMVCRGGLDWYKNSVVVFPCRVQDRTDEVHFYSINTNLDTSRVLTTLSLSSPISKLNIHGNHLVLATRNCQVIICKMDGSCNVTDSPSLSVTRLHILSFSEAFTRPWALTLISVTPASLRMEPGDVKDNRLSSILLNVGGRVLMVQRELPRPQVSQDKQREVWQFSAPVCLAPSVEAMWTPPTGSASYQSGEYLRESLWMACGKQGVKVWLPLFPEDTGHPTFISKRIMLTLPSSTSSSFPISISFHEAIIVGLSHEPIHGDHSIVTPLYFPPSTIRKTTQLFLDQILRQLLKRNLGSHAYQIACSHTHLPYFAHILELMLHEILEEEAPGSIPIPDALLPRVVEFIKQFPQFLETIGFCARKTEVALWNYLFAAVGNPKDLFELCLNEGRLKTAASYLIIIQNLQPSSVSRHLATRLLDAALDNSQWQLCKDLVRFLKAIGPVDISNPTSPANSMTPSTPARKPMLATPLATPTAIPDLDQSMVSLARDHLTSGGLGNVLSVSGEYRDPSGRIIKRPHFALDMDTKEEFFIELILSRHARKLLTTTSLHDLGLFAAHLDFNLVQWMGRERQRAARVEDFPQALVELHRQFNWPFPATSPNTTPIVMTASFSYVHEMKPHLPTQKSKENSPSLSGGEINRPNRPPDLDLSLTQGQIKELKHDVVRGVASEQCPKEEEVDVTATTPSKASQPSSAGTAGSDKPSAFPKIQSSDLLPADESVCASETLPDDTSMCEGEGDVSMANASWTTPVKSPQSEEEIKFFVNVSIDALCLEWVLLLATLLQNQAVLSDLTDRLSSLDTSTFLPEDTGKRVIDGLEKMTEWAEEYCPGYLIFLSAINPLITTWQQHLAHHHKEHIATPHQDEPRAPTPSQGSQVKQEDKASSASATSSSDTSQRSAENANTSCTVQ